MKNSARRPIEQRLRKALACIEASKNEQLRGIVNRVMQRDHEDLMGALGNREHIVEEIDLALALSMLNDDVDPVLAQVSAQTVVLDNGNILGTGKYRLADPGWLLAGIEWLEHLLIPDHPFGNEPSTLRMPDDHVTLALVGDFGTGYWQGEGTPAARVAAQMARRRPHYVIHLGDVYYAGTSDEVRRHLVDLLPRGTLATLDLNANHVMYNSGYGYFGALPQFGAQGKTSYAALENEHWLVLCLDSAYHADKYERYSPGSLQRGSRENSQTAWLAQMAGKAASKRVLVLTHHQGLSFDGTTETMLYQQVTRHLGRVPNVWYWGHVHKPVVYHERDGFRPRCAGHGAIPYGRARLLDDSPHVAWYETELADDCDVRVQNGFVLLALRGPELHETFIGEDGSVRWCSA